ncbi:MAG: hypothetical protein IJ287_02260 [Methanobrevibacter sp.]|nr:hypothetical protein [Methanobrevibacter sp.]
MNYNYADSTAGAVFINGANTIDNSKFSENYVNYDQSKGAAIRVDGVNAEILNSEFDNHYAVDGGAIHWVGANGTIKGSKFNKNTAKSAGGAILWEGVNGTIEGSEFNENTAKSAGAIDVRNNLVINNTKFNKNSASTFAGALYIQHDNAVVNNSEFNKNYANEAGAIEIHGMNITIDCSNFTENKAMPESEVAHTNYGRGGAILIRDLENNQDLTILFEVQYSSIMKLS